MRHLRLLVAISTLACTTPREARAQAQAQGGDARTARNAFHAAAPLTEPRRAHAAALLADGRVLIVGGQRADGDWLRTAEIYDPTRETSTRIASTRSAHRAPRLTPLRDGRILLSGGVDQGGSTLLGLEIFDPLSGQFVSQGAGTLRYPEHSTTLLADGRVLLASSEGAERFDPQTRSFTRVDRATFILGGGVRPAALLADGRVLLAGGPAPSSGGGQHAYAELYLPDRGAFMQTGGMQVGRGRLTLTALSDGSAIAIGGFQSYGGLRVDVHATAEVYDPKANVFVPTGSMQVGRAGHSATLLPSGRVLVTGPGAEVYDPATRTFAVTAGAPLVDRQGATATLLDDGRVLITGGETNQASGPLATCELYVPEA